MNMDVMIKIKRKVKLVNIDVSKCFILTN